MCTHIRLQRSCISQTLNSCGDEFVLRQRIFVPDAPVSAPALESTTASALLRATF